MDVKAATETTKILYLYNLCNLVTRHSSKPYCEEHKETVVPTDK